MNAGELVALELPQECGCVAYDALKARGLISNPVEASRRITELLAAPESFINDPHFAALAQAVIAARTQLEEAKESWGRNPHDIPSTFAQWGERDDPGSM